MHVLQWRELADVDVKGIMDSGGMNTAEYSAIIFDDDCGSGYGCNISEFASKLVS